MNGTKQWRMGIIGCGWAGSQHAQAIRTLESRATLCAVADVNLGLAAAIASQFSAPVCTSDYRELLTSGELDAVCIALPHRLHAEVAVAAAEAGLHVFIEKPLATTLAEADAMIAAADRAGVQLMVGENVRYDPTYLRAGEILRAGVLGDVFLVNLTREHQIHEYLRQRPWFLTDADGGITYTGAIHEFDLLRMLAGEIQHVYALAAPKTLPQMMTDETSVILAGLHSGASAVIVESYSNRSPYPGIHGTLYGSQGSLWFYKDRIRVYTAVEDGHPELVQDIAVHLQNTFDIEIAHFIDCLDRASEPITSGREERKPLVAVLAAYESMRRGERVYLSELT